MTFKEKLNQLLLPIGIVLLVFSIAVGALLVGCIPVYLIISLINFMFDIHITLGLVWYLILSVVYIIVSTAIFNVLIKRKIKKLPDLTEVMTKNNWIH